MRAQILFLLLINLDHATPAKEDIYMDMYQLYLLKALNSLNILVLLVIMSEAAMKNSSFYKNNGVFFAKFRVIVERSRAVITVPPVFIRIVY